MLSKRVRDSKADFESDLSAMCVCMGVRYVREDVFVWWIVFYFRCDRQLA